jgi:cell division protein FtsW
MIEITERVERTERRISQDYLLLLSAISLLGLGLIMVTSASLTLAEGLKLPAWHFALRHALSLTVGVIGCVIVTRVPLLFWQSLALPGLLMSIVSLALLLIPGISREVNGSVRWLFLGPISIQVSEFVKLAMIIYMASYLVRREEEVQTRLSGFLKPLIILSLISALLMLEPDFGAAVVIISTAMGMLFLGGVPFRRFLTLFLLAIGTLIILSITSPYRLRRLTTFLDPWSDQFNGGYQLTQSLIAFGRGGFFGTGLGNSVQKLLYLPEPHTDFLYAVLAEELGMMGALGILLLFSILVWRALVLGRKAILRGKPFAGFVAFGIGLWIGFQALINIGVNVGVLPTKGLTLPFMSYGNNSLVVGLLALGLLFRVHIELQKNVTITKNYKTSQVNSLNIEF